MTDNLKNQNGGDMAPIDNRQSAGNGERTIGDELAEKAKKRIGRADAASKAHAQPCNHLAVHHSQGMADCAFAARVCSALAKDWFLGSDCGAGCGMDGRMDAHQTL